jgi:hypothetical protein
MSNRSELYQRQIAIEKEELAASPEEEAEKLALIYQSKGLPEAAASSTPACANSSSAMEPQASPTP